MIQFADLGGELAAFLAYAGKSLDLGASTRATLEAALHTEAPPNVIVTDHQGRPIMIPADPAPFAVPPAVTQPFQRVLRDDAGASYQSASPEVPSISFRPPRM